MNKFYELEYKGVEKKIIYDEIISKVVEKCYEVEGLLDSSYYISITLTTPEQIREINKQYRNIDKETDVLSFPMFEKEEIDTIIKEKQFINVDILGDMIISIERVEKQAKEYGHSFEREFAYMIVHSFYHLMGYDHIKEEDKQVMRPKEEFILENLNIRR